MLYLLRKKKGFSLIEMVTVLAIITVSMGIFYRVFFLNWEAFDTFIARADLSQELDEMIDKITYDGRFSKQITLTSTPTVKQAAFFDPDGNLIGTYSIKNTGEFVINRGTDDYTASTKIDFTNSHFDKRGKSVLVTLALTDRIFTRVGASDNLSRGRSTFLVEMIETANILNSATARSLVLLDEVGRGTATFDGLSLAWAIAEYIHDDPHHAAKTIFATHYHEMTELAKMRPGVRNYQVAVSEANDEIVFLRRVIPGPANKSYGIEVARLAGVPQTVIERAREILTNLEQNELDMTGKPKFARHLKKPSKFFNQPSLLDLTEETGGTEKSP